MQALRHLTSYCEPGLTLPPGLFHSLSSAHVGQPKGGKLCDGLPIIRFLDATQTFEGTVLVSVYRLSSSAIHCEKSIQQEICQH